MADHKQQNGQSGKQDDRQEALANALAQIEKSF